MEVVNALGRRKSAIARIFVSEGTGKITINKRDLAEYFPSSILQYVVKQPLNSWVLLKSTTSKLISAVAVSPASLRLCVWQLPAHW